MPELSDVEMKIVDFFIDKKSMTIKGIVGGVESTVNANCNVVDFIANY